MRTRRGSAWLVVVGVIAAVLVGRATPASSAAGALDNTYGTNGLAAVDFGNGSNDSVTDLVVQTDGSVTAVGPTDLGFGIVRLKPSGVLDTAFGTGGVVSGNFMVDVRGVALQSDGKVLVTGRSAATGGSLVVARYTATGALDSTFGTAGKVTTTMTGAGSGGADIVVQTDGKPVVLAVDNGVLAALRYTPAGVLDTTFGTGGRYTSAFTPGGNPRLVLQGTNLLLTGADGTGGGVARLTPAGALDTGFNTTGTATTANHVIRAAGAMTDGRVVLGGDFGAADSKALVVRRVATGALDPTWGTAGVASFAVTGLAKASVRALVVTTDGKVVVAGRLGDTTRQSALFVARLTSAGVLDTGFNSTGIVSLTSLGGQSTSTVDALAPLGATGYVLGGSVINTQRNFTNDNDMAVARLAAGDEPAGGGPTTTLPPGTVGAGDSASSDPDGTVPDPNNKLVATVLTPVTGKVSFVDATPAAVAGYRAIAAMSITAPAATAAAPLQLTLDVDVSGLPDELPLGAVVVLRDGVAVVDCTSPAIAAPDPCVASRDRAGDTLTIQVLTSKASTWTVARPIVQRIFGDDRMASAIAVSRSSWSDDGAAAVVLARSDSFADALAATPLAVAKKGPLLLTPTGALDDRVLAEITRILPDGKEVYLLGGERALSPAVANRLVSWGFEVVRYSGADRYATAYLVATEGLESPKDVIVTTGLSFADALTAGVVAASMNGAVLLTQGNVMPESTRTYLNDNAPTVVAFGGPAAATLPEAQKVVGSDRYETAALAAKLYFAEAKMVGMASGASFADALSGGVHAASVKGPLLLTPPTGTLPAGVGIYLRGLPAKPSAAYLYGGTNAVGADVATALLAALGG